jgi:hypothetical protein
MLPVVTRLRDFRTYGHPLLLIAVWASLHAATIAWIALLPGDPFLRSSGQPIFVTAIIALSVSWGSRVAWWLAIFSSAVAVFISVALGVFEFGVKPWGVALFQAAALWLLWSGNIEMYVQSNRRMRRLAGAPPGH